MAQVTMDFTPTQDAGIDANSLGEHNNRGGDYQVRFCKGMATGGEYAIFAFDKTAVQNFINSNLGGQTLQQAINAGKIQVDFSLVAANLIDPDRQVGVMAPYTNDNWIEGDGTGTNDASFNWTGGFTGAQAVTLDSPNDFLGQAYNGTGGGNWARTDNNWVGQQLNGIPGTLNSSLMTGWVQNERTSVQLDDALWAQYLYGVDSNTGAAVPQSSMLKTYGFSWDSTGGDPASANMSCYTKEDTSAGHRPLLTVTIQTGTGHIITPHPGDANNDGAVDVIDLGILATNYDKTGLPTDPDKFGKGSWKLADFNNDGNVDVIDLGVLATNYDWVGAPATSAVPEPATMAMLAFGGIAALIRRRK